MSYLINSTTTFKNISYKVEDDLNFYDELQKMLDDNTIENKIINNNEDNICLLTKVELEPNHITLECKHKFNYLPLYKEVLNQKQKNNNYYLESTRLLNHQIKCPYCRSINNKILPFIEYPDVKQVKYVNSPKTLSMDTSKCCFIYKNGYSKNKQCSTNALYFPDAGLYCNKHYKIHKESLENSNKIKKQKINNTGCSALLKTGAKKGSLCGCKTYLNGLYCKRHTIITIE